MIVISDVSNKQWVCIDEPTSDTSFILSIGFRDDDGLPVIFSGLQFGYSINSVSKSFPQGDIIFERTDQDLLISERVDDLSPETSYDLSVWCVNDGERWESTFLVTTTPKVEPVP